SSAETASSATMARKGERFRDCSGTRVQESPVLGASEDVGDGNHFEVNPLSTSGNKMFDRLRYSAEMPVWVQPCQPLARQPDWPRSGLNLDADGDDVFHRDHEYAFGLADVRLG